MGTWKTRGLRGSALEEYINYSNEKYREAGLALIQKIPTPITPIDIDKSTRHITLAYFDKKSTVDYIGAVQGLPVCFDAKECAAESFKSLDKIMYVPLSDLRVFMDRMYAGGKKSFKFEELNLEYEIPKKGDIIVHYLESLSLYLLDR